MRFQRLTPVHIVDAIEPVLPYWKGLGFTVVVEVPEDKGLGFVLLAAGEVRLMLQTRKSLAADLPAIARLKPSTVLYADVDSLAAALASMPGAELLVPERKASYGPKEAAVRTASGHIVLFAEET